MSLSELYIQYPSTVREIFNRGVAYGRIRAEEERRERLLSFAPKKGKTKRS
jgi:hypothetical protein